MPTVGRSFSRAEDSGWPAHDAPEPVTFRGVLEESPPSFPNPVHLSTGWAVQDTPKTYGQKPLKNKEMGEYPEGMGKLLLLGGFSLWGVTAHVGLSQPSQMGLLVWKASR